MTKRRHPSTRKAKPGFSLSDRPRLAFTVCAPDGVVIARGKNGKQLVTGSGGNRTPGRPLVVTKVDHGRGEITLDVWPPDGEALPCGAVPTAGVEEPGRVGVLVRISVYPADTGPPAAHAELITEVDPFLLRGRLAEDVALDLARHLIAEARRRT